MVFIFSYWLGIFSCWSHVVRTQCTLWPKNPTHCTTMSHSPSYVPMMGYHTFCGLWAQRGFVNIKHSNNPTKNGCGWFGRFVGQGPTWIIKKGKVNFFHSCNFATVGFPFTTLAMCAQCLHGGVGALDRRGSTGWVGGGQSCPNIYYYWYLFIFTFSPYAVHAV